MLLKASISGFVKTHKLLLLLTLFYFIFRLINLTLLPIFNDEAIYLDWGWRETHRAGFLYYSLYDAKQPFLMWIFGIAESILSDPLFAGRLVSVFAGFLTFCGLYKIGKDYFNQKVGLIASLFYIIIPLFSFYDRQALMESAIGAVGAWSFYFLSKSLINEKSIKFPLILGVVLGIGFFIKSSALLFVGAAIVVLIIVEGIFHKNSKWIDRISFIAVGFLVIVSPLIINPQFWQTFSSNSRYSLTIAELIKLPFFTWFTSLIANLQISLVFLTPLVFLFSWIGIGLIAVQKQKLQLALTIFFVFNVLTTTLLVRVPSDRYLVSFLPLSIISLAYLLVRILDKHLLTGLASVIIIAVVPLGLTVVQLINPPLYLSATMPYAPSVNSTYLSGYTSGYGLNQAVSYINNLSKNKPIAVGVAENTGNPESALIVYFNSSSRVKVVYFALEDFPPDLMSYACLNFNEPLYFVSRDDQLSGLDKFFSKVKTIRNPYGTNTIGIYKQKDNCTGKTLFLNLNAN